MLLRRAARPLRPLASAACSLSAASSLSRGFRATPSALLAWNRHKDHAPPTKWRWEPEPGQVAGAPHTNMRPRPRRPGELSLLQRLDKARIARGAKPRRLIKTRKRIALARHTHIARFRLRRGPAPRMEMEWDDPERATRDAMIQFIDPYELDPDLAEPGRRWHAAEIRLKSNEDLQKLWVVLLKERNMLYSTKLLHRKRQTTMPHRGRLKATRKSMAMIKLVLRKHISLSGRRAGGRADGFDGLTQPIWLSTRPRRRDAALVTAALAASDS